MRAAQGFVPALLLAAGAVVSSCGGDEFCSPGSYECSGTPTAGKGGAGTGGSSGEGALGGSTGTGGSAAGKAGSAAVGGSTGGGEAGAGAGGQAGVGTGATGATGGSTGAGGTSTGGSSAVSGDGGDSGAGGMAPVKCDPTDPHTGCELTGKAGIFVAPAASGGDDANNGTQSAPVASVTHGIELAAMAQVPVYVCAGTYKEHVEITDDDLSLRGAYTCENSLWVYAPSKRSRIAPTTKNEALRVKSVNGLEVTDMELTAASATAPGASSVGVFVSGSQDVVFTRVRVNAGNGMAGESGTLAPYTYADADLLKGNDAVGATPGAGRADCPVCEGASVETMGGNGGLAQQNGTPGEPQSLGGGNGGAFGPTVCSSGGRGGDAAPGSDGSGAQAAGLVSPTGWEPSAGAEAENGTPGQGGGGGGGATNSGQGTGGGGACGGCGGKGGGFGKGGGASIAILAVGSKVTLHACTLQTGSAGKGGDGVAGQDGQLGGAHGNGSNFGCQGGDGGTGSPGGAGGGGAGGISVGIVYDTAASVITTDNKTVITPGTPGLGGLGGGASNKGIDGVAVKQLAI